MGSTSIDIEDLELTVNIHVDATKTFTTAVVTLSQGAAEWAGLGTAKRARGDRYNEQTGLTVSVARALHDLADYMEAEGLRG